MCGFVASKGHSLNLADVIKDINYRGLRGYEGYGVYKDMQFAHTSLPFVNLDPEVAIQPFYNDHNIPNLFVGEIFNHYIFGEFENDTACISYLYDEYGHDIFHEFDGFWSFVTVFDNHLIAYTDFLSIKPVYYRTDCEALASEIDVLKQFGPVTPNKTFLSNVLKWGYNPGPETPWNEIKQIPPGCYYWKGNIHSYWDWSSIQYNDLYGDLDKSIERRFKGEREIAMLLSGGLDSTIIYALLKQSNKKIKVLHVDNDEAEWAKKVLSYFGNSDEMISLDFNSVSDKEALSTHQTPVDLGSVKPQIAMAKEIQKQGLHCVFSGDGADELFGGYTRANDYDSQHSDVFMELPYYHLPRLDRTMMKHTIEMRCPFLAPYIIKQALELPYNMRNGVKKALIDTFDDIIPSEIIHRKKHALKTPSIRKNPMETRIYNRNNWEKLHELR